MGRYSIKELEKLSGIKAHTIRIWEKRHRLVSPQRTQTNIRYYSDEDLKKIINVSVLNNHGVKISRIVGLSLADLNQKVSELSETNNTIEIHIDQLVLAMIDLEEEKFEKILSNLILKFGFERTIVEIVYPFLEKIGVLWLTNNISPAQEHFISNLIRQKLIVAIDGLPLAPKSAPKILLFLPENELHELALLFYYYLAKQRGLRTYYLGQTVPHKDLKSVYDEHQPALLVTSLTSGPSPKILPSYLARLSQDFAAAKILVSGSALKKARVESYPNITTFSNALNFKELISN
ncbi:MAG: MerR family transcriptional regulator [Cyclobacteriaceae bacterium]|nr:MerR family transcriptional regulator [Cyclobacteriaceae bacterium]